MKEQVINPWTILSILVFSTGIICYAFSHQPNISFGNLTRWYYDGMVLIGNPLLLLFGCFAFINKDNLRRLPQITLAGFTGLYFVIYAGFALFEFYLYLSDNNHELFLEIACGCLVILAPLLTLLYSIIKKKRPRWEILFLMITPPLLLLVSSMADSWSGMTAIAGLLILPCGMAWCLVLIKEIRKLALTVIRHYLPSFNFNSERFQHIATEILRWGTVQTVIFFIITEVLYYLLVQDALKNASDARTSFYFSLSIHALLSTLLIYWCFTLPHKKVHD